MIDHFHHYFVEGVSQSKLIMVHYSATACLNVEIQRDRLLDDYKNCKTVISILNVVWAKIITTDILLRYPILRKILVKAAFSIRRGKQTKKLLFSSSSIQSFCSPQNVVSIFLVSYVLLLLTARCFCIHYSKF